MIPGSGGSPGEGLGYPLQYSCTYLVAQMVKNLPAMWETLVRSLDWEDALKKGMTPTPVFLPGEFHGQKSLAGYSPWAGKELEMTEQISLHFTLWRSQTSEFISECTNSGVFISYYSLFQVTENSLQWFKQHKIRMFLFG